jgi:hypothetical protein
MRHYLSFLGNRSIVKSISSKTFQDKKTKAIKNANLKKGSILFNLLIV